MKISKIQAHENEDKKELSVYIEPDGNIIIIGFKVRPPSRQLLRPYEAAIRVSPDVLRDALHSKGHKLEKSVLPLPMLKENFAG